MKRISVPALVCFLGVTIGIPRQAIAQTRTNGAGVLPTKSTHVAVGNQAASPVQHQWIKANSRSAATPIIGAHRPSLRQNSQYQSIQLTPRYDTVPSRYDRVEQVIPAPSYSSSGYGTLPLSPTTQKNSNSADRPNALSPPGYGKVPPENPNSVYSKAPPPANRPLPPGYEQVPPALAEALNRKLPRTPR